ncbi:MAG TPA: transcriptional regulator [Pirellulales bacterium]|nr:transcriptional regulator [Pirellulales bacterium]
MKPATNGKAGSMTGDQNGRDKKTAKRKTGDRFAILNAFIDFTMGDLDRAEMAVWFALYRDTKPDGLARTSQADLARRAGTTDRTVRRAIASLERRRLLKIVHRGGLQKGASTYRILPLMKPPQ